MPIERDHAKRRVKRVPAPFDEAVVGGGPAGTSAAITLAHGGARVVVLERTDYGAVRAGESIRPACKPLLVRLGAWERFASAGHHPSPVICSAWGRPELVSRDALFDPHGTGWHVDRRAFDEMLASCAEESGVTVWRSTRALRFARTRSRWQIRTMSEEGAISIAAPFVIAATGRLATIARERGAEVVVHDDLVGLVRFTGPSKTAPASAPPADPLRVTLVEAVPDGWWYSAPLPSGAVVVAYMTDADLVGKGRSGPATTWREALALAPRTQRRCHGAPASRASLRVVTARSQHVHPAAGEGWIAVGDAALAMDPLSSVGVFEALRSGVDAAARVLAGDSRSLSQYAVAAAERTHAYLDIRRAYYRAETRWTGSAFWKRRRS